MSESVEGGLALLAFGSDAQLIALGKMSVVFALLDESLTEITAGLLDGVPDLMPDKTPLSLMGFDQKRKLLKSVLRETSARSGIDSSDFAACLVAVKAASRARNLAIHGWLIWDQRRAVPVFRTNRGEEVEASLEQLLETNRLIGDAWTALVREFGVFIKLANEKYDPSPTA